AASGRTGKGSSEGGDWRRVAGCSSFAPPMPPHLLLRGGIIWLFSGTFNLAAQSSLTLVATGTADSIAVNAYVGDTGDGPAVLRADWTGLEGRAPSFKMHRPATTDAGEEVELVELFLAGVEQYLDQRIHFTRNGV